MGNILQIKASNHNLTQTVCSDILIHDTYFGLIVEYLPLKIIFSKIILLSQYHLDFISNTKNKNIIKRLISNQIGTIFKISSPFNTFYTQHNITPYKLISKFYTDFGWIQQIAFPNHHNTIMDYYSKWINEEQTYPIDYKNAIIIDNEYENEYYNPFYSQYNAIKYDKIPFDFAIISRLNKSELIIHWLQFIMNQSVIDCKYLDCIHLNDHETSNYTWQERQSIIGICSINNSYKTGGGISFFYILLRTICHLPSIEFKIVIKFILHNSLRIDIQHFLCANLNFFCAVNNKQIGCDNYLIYVNECIKHESFKEQQSQIINAINRNPFCKFNLYKTIWYIISKENTANGYSKQFWNEIATNKYYKNMFGKVGYVLRKYGNEVELFNYLESTKDIELPTNNNLNIKSDDYNELFLTLLGFI
eukprot:331506_1